MALRSLDPQLPSPLVYRGTLYIVNDAGIVTLLDPATGSVRAQGRIKGALDNFWASPIGSDSKVFMVSDSCKVVVLKAGGDLEPLVVNDLDDQCSATPAIADARLYVRTRSALYAFGMAKNNRVNGMGDGPKGDGRWAMGNEGANPNNRPDFQADSQSALAHRTSP